MKTLVIHPQDYSTDFLKPIYEGKGYTLITKLPGKRLLKQAIKEHDRIIMMGHGCEKGLFDGEYNAIITSDFVALLREKESVAIWCNADVFFLKYKLKGVYTGMIISEYMESQMYNVFGDYQDIETSNKEFAKYMTDFIEDKDLDKFKEGYFDDDNHIIKFNIERVYLTECVES
jgi:hypothetical protein